jgi:hypothetical protein
MGPELLLPAAMLGMSIYSAIENKGERDKQKAEKRAAIKYNPYRKEPMQIPGVQQGSVSKDLLAGGLGAASMYQGMEQAKQNQALADVQRNYLQQKMAMENMNPMIKDSAYNMMSNPDRLFVPGKLSPMPVNNFDYIPTSMA